MQYIELVAITALLQFLFFGVLTGNARGKAGIKAPTMTGDEGFERMFRVQMNTLEALVMFLPALFIASNYWSHILVAGLGAVYLLGRVIYWRAYVADPKKRGLGFMLSILPTVILMILSIVGIIMSLV